MPLRTVVLLSDLHVHPRYGPAVRPACYCDALSAGDPRCALERPAAYGQLGCDAPPSLVRAALEDAAAEIDAPDVVLVAGDLVWHRAQSVYDTRALFANVSAQVAAAFGGAHAPPLVCFAIGNNDVYPDYAVNVSEYDDLAASSGPLCGLNAAEVAAFARRGYYARPLWEGTRLLVLNTDVYSVHSRAPPELAPAPAAARSATTRARRRRA